MKKEMWFAVAALMLCACGTEDRARGSLTPVSEKLSPAEAMVHPTRVCGEGTCSNTEALTPLRSQQALSGVAYSTFLGFSDWDGATAVTVDAWGNAYVLGLTNSFGSSPNIFVAKLGPAGNLLYFTYFPGCCAYSLAVDGGGSVFIVGTSLTHFVAKLNSTGSAFLSYSYLPSGMLLKDIVVDAAGNPYVAGLQMTGSTPNYADVFVGKLTSGGSSFVYGVSFGGSVDDLATSIAIDGSGNVYVTGRTSSSNFPVWNAFQPTYPGSHTAFIAKLNAAGTGLVYSTYLGGSGSNSWTQGWGIAVDGAGNAYVAGQTTTPNHPVTFGAFQPFFGGGTDAFLTKVNATGGLVYSTYLGGGDVDVAKDVAVDPSTGSAYVVGSTRSYNLPVTSNAFQPSLWGFQDVFVTQVSPSGGALSYSSYLGGSGYEQNLESFHIALDSARNLYLASDTASTDFPTNIYGYGGGTGDAFVTKFRGP